MEYWDILLCYIQTNNRANFKSLDKNDAQLDRREKRPIDIIYCILIRFFSFVGLF